MVANRESKVLLSLLSYAGKDGDAFGDAVGVEGVDVGRYQYVSFNISGAVLGSFL